MYIYVCNICRYIHGLQKTYSMCVLSNEAGRGSALKLLWLTVAGASIFSLCHLLRRPYYIFLFLILVTLKLFVTVVIFTEVYISIADE